ncbi:MAG TPA: cytidine deaminase [Chitinophagaceae bacterium]|nr:cytidine deaminase [Chitinophagaceae bacterium]MCC6634639.1 cytidine deaminase [Chitinophagaceae bacterium]HMZ47033.1 cytidine deaminase [Chitinophagaceae bacterium]HNE93592.1 cytidine deaminase [Chitinophagaceae bacterium]HNF29918.1 cytidine deaminase [Chitinophagaceae bacterium]
MSVAKFSIEIDEFKSIEELDAADVKLLQLAQKIAENAYAPYSNFYVGAVAMLNNNQIITGTNQENASYPVGTCAERVLLAIAATSFPNIPLKTMAISYLNKNGLNNHPISPCGMCRQYLLEYEQRVKQPIRLILGGQVGKVYIIKSVADLLPLNFSADDFKK